MTSEIPEIFRRADNPLIAGAAKAAGEALKGSGIGVTDLDTILRFAKEFVPLLGDVTKHISSLRGMEGSTQGGAAGDNDPGDWADTPTPSGSPGAKGAKVTGAKVLQLIVGELGKVPADMTAGQMLQWANGNRDSIIPQLDLAIKHLLG